jgi:hypothetical protein
MTPEYPQVTSQASYRLRSRERRFESYWGALHYQAVYHLASANTETL